MNKGPLDWKAKNLSRNFLQIDIPAKRINDWEFWALLMSDIHFDSVKCDRESLKRDLDKAVERRASVMMFGDSLDLMQGPGDRRAWLKELRSEYAGNPKDYLNNALDDFTAFMTPYRKNLSLLALGNHETSYAKRIGFDFIENLVGSIRAGQPSNLYSGGYAGNVRFSFLGEKGRAWNCKNLKYHHGSKLKSEAAQIRFVAENPGCDMFVFGHYHKDKGYNLASQPIADTGLGPKQRKRVICLGTYKDDRSDSHEGYATENAHGLTLTQYACQWVRFFCLDARENKWGFEMREI